MLKISGLFITVATFAGLTHAASAAPTAGATTVLGPFTGHFAPLHPDNQKPEPVRYYGTDLGWSYEHAGKIYFLFGDTHATPYGETISPTHDDMWGTIDLADWPDPTRIGPDNLPRIKLATIPGTHRIAGMDPGIPMEGLKTPVGGFSDGGREFALFITGKPEACRKDSDCSNGLTCDTNLGYVGSRPDTEPGLSFGCDRSWPACNAGTMFDANGKADAASGFCVDRTSSLAVDSAYGRVSAVGMKHIFGMRSATEPAKYVNTSRWLTNKFINVAVRKVTHDGTDRVFFWGRPHFIGVNAKGATLGMYFAYADKLKGPDYLLKLHYFAGADEHGNTRFSANERDAVPLDLDAATPGVQSKEIYDVVQHMSVVWIDQLKKWVMFYGGGMTKTPNPAFGADCGALQIFTRDECKHVVLGNGALRMRTADKPWGPWTAPQDLIVGGDPDQRPVADQYAEGGVLYHQECKGAKCATRTPVLPENDYGWFYGANIIEQWTRPAGNGVDVIWNASTWSPYRVILLRTRINR